MEYFDIVNEYGEPTGETVSREIAHRDGIRHRTAHVWVVKRDGGRTQVLMQKRSDDKDSFPGMYDTSSAGHIPAGDEPIDSALRELKEELGIKAVGVSGKDGGLLHVRKKLSGGEDIGFVGDVDKVQPGILRDLIDNDYLPVVSPVGFDDSFDTYNINADDAACEIAKAVGAEKLAFLTDIEGLYRDINDKSSFISKITVSDAKALIASGTLGGGMLPKLTNCTSAMEAGVNRVHILDGRIPHCLLLEIFTREGIGTMIMPDSDEE